MKDQIEQLRVEQLEKQLELKEFSTRRRLAALKRQVITESLKSSAQLLIYHSGETDSHPNLEPSPGTQVYTGHHAWIFLCTLYRPLKVVMATTHHHPWQPSWQYHVTSVRVSMLMQHIGRGSVWPEYDSASEQLPSYREHGDYAHSPHHNGGC